MCIRDRYGEAIKKLIADEKVKGIVLASAKDAFIAGADLTSSDVFGFDQKDTDKTKAAEKIYNGNMEMQKPQNLETWIWLSRPQVFLDF